MRAATCLLVVVAACHGGGRSNANGIRLDTVTTSVTAGGAAITLAASVQGAAEAVSWELSGPGALASTKGQTTSYSPPSCATQTSSAIVTATASGASASVTLEIQPAPGANCLTISPDSTEVTIGEGTLTLTANVSASAGEVTWSLYGPGSLSSAKGTSTVYTPPESLVNDTQISVTITASTSSAAMARTLVRITPRWTLNTDGTAGALAFDGTNVWVHVQDRGPRLIKIRASDRTIQGTYPVPAARVAMLVQDAFLWVGYEDGSGGHLVCLQTSDGALVAAAQTGERGPVSLAFDGTSIWFSDASGRIGRLRASDTQPLGTSAATGTALVFDGVSLWAARNDIGALSRIRISDGANLGNLYVGAAIYQPAVDRAGGLWVLNYPYPNPGRTLVHVDGPSGMVLDVSKLPDTPDVALIEGDYLWTIGQDRIRKRRLSDLQIQNTWAVYSAVALVSDGVHMWVSSGYGGYVTRL